MIKKCIIVISWTFPVAMPTNNTALPQTSRRTLPRVPRPGGVNTDLLHAPATSIIPKFKCLHKALWASRALRFSSLRGVEESLVALGQGVPWLGRERERTREGTGNAGDLGSGHPSPPPASTARHHYPSPHYLCVFSPLSRHFTPRSSSVCCTCETDAISGGRRPCAQSVQ